MLLNRLKTLILLVVLFVTCCFNSPAIADSIAPTPESPPIESAPTPRTGLDANAISSEKLSQFVQAYLQVVGLIEQREVEFQSAETESESLRIQQDIEKEAIALIETTGLTLQEYLQLLSLANIDPEFSERVIAQLQEAEP
jgi:hypothetical protein